MDSPLADWSRSLNERLLAPRMKSLTHPGRNADEVLRNMLVLIGTVKFAKALCRSPDVAEQGLASQKLAAMCAPVEVAVEQLAERIRRNDAQRNALYKEMRTLARMADDEAGWAGAMHSYELHKPLSQEVIHLCQAAEIGIDPEFYQKNLPRAVKQALEWLRERL